MNYLLRLCVMNLLKKADFFEMPYDFMLEIEHIKNYQDLLSCFAFFDDYAFGVEWDVL